MIKAEFYSQSWMESAGIYLKALKWLSYYYVLDKQDGDHVLTKLPRAVTSSKELWHGDYCCVPDCKNPLAVTRFDANWGYKEFHFILFPTSNQLKESYGLKWFIVILVPNKYTIICSAHFKPDDFRWIAGGWKTMPEEWCSSINFPLAWHKWAQIINMSAATR